VKVVRAMIRLVEIRRRRQGSISSIGRASEIHGSRPVLLPRNVERRTSGVPKAEAPKQP
jgi:hypothetical protein